MKKLQKQRSKGEAKKESKKTKGRDEEEEEDRNTNIHAEEEEAMVRENKGPMKSNGRLWTNCLLWPNSHSQKLVGTMKKRQKWCPKILALLCAFCGFLALHAHSCIFVVF